MNQLWSPLIPEDKNCLVLHHLIYYQIHQSEKKSIANLYPKEIYQRLVPKVDHRSWALYAFFHFSRWTERHCSSAGSRWCAFLIFAFLARSWTAALFCLFWPHSSHFHIFAVFAPPSLSLLGSSSIVPFVPHQTGHHRNKCTPTAVGHEMKSESWEMSLRLQNWESWWRVPGTHHRMTVRQWERQRRRDPRFCETPCPPVTNHQRSANSITHQHT